jgi:hypothetical protein
MLGAIRLAAQEPDDALLAGDVRITPARLAGQRVPPSDGEDKIVGERLPDCFPIAALERLMRLAKECFIRVHVSPPSSENSHFP